MIPAFMTTNVRHMTLPSGQPIEIRPADPTEIEALARLRHDGWHDAHAAIVPAALVRVRTFENFAARLADMLGKVRVVGPLGAPQGLHLIAGDELYQFYVAARARGTGVAASLIADAEARLAEAGVETAWLECAIGNERAAKFYEKCGWRRSGTVAGRLYIPNGTFEMNVWRYEKRLTAGVGP